MIAVGPGLLIAGLQSGKGFTPATIVGLIFTLIFALMIFFGFRRRRPPTFKEFLARCRRHVKLETKDDERLFSMIADCRMHDAEYIEWQARRATWSTSWPPTDKQLALLSALGYVGKTPRSVIAASDLIDEMKVVSEYMKEKADRRKQREKLERAKDLRKAREAMIEEERQRKADAKRAERLARQRTTPPRPRVSANQRMKWLYEFQQLWNDSVSADETITRRNTEELHAWLLAHRTADTLHEDFIDALANLLDKPGDQLAIPPEIYDMAATCASQLGGKVVAF